MLTSPSELLQFLSSIGKKPSKRLSQNFLIDANIIRKILSAADIQANDTVLEIGPGPGALTEALLNKGAQVFAVEKDTVFAEALKRFQGPLQVFAEDIRTFNLFQLPKHTKVVSNLPYHLTAPILTLLAPRHELFPTLTLMVQEEVARRICAQPKTKEYGSLTVFLNFYSTPKYAFKVSHRCFYPAPKVDSAVVVLTLKQPPTVNTDQFFPFVHTAFQQRRKMIKSTLGKHIGPLLEELGENPNARPEELSLDLFLKLFQKISSA